MAAVNFEGLEVEQGFNFARDVQKPVGHLTMLKIGTDSFAADMTVKKPDDMNDTSVVGLMSKITWNGGHGDAIVFSANISTPNKQKLALLLHKSLNNTNVEFKFTVYEYDPVAKLYFVAFQAAGDAVLKAILKNDGGNLKVTIGAKGTVQSPENWSVDLEVVPIPQQQDIQLATANQSTVVKKWGVTVSGKK